MARISSQKFTVEGFKEQMQWIGKLFSPLNQLIGEILSAFNNNITVQDNLKQEIKELTFINQTQDLPLKFMTKFAQNPKGLSVLYCYDNTNSEMNFAGPIWANWSYGNSTITINSLTGLTSGRKYTIRFHVIYE